MTDRPMPEVPQAAPMTLKDAELAAIQILAMLTSMMVLQKGVLTTVQTALERGDKARLKSLPVCDVPATQHRREHRFGRPKHWTPMHSCVPSSSRASTGSPMSRLRTRSQSTFPPSAASAKAQLQLVEPCGRSKRVFTMIRTVRDRRGISGVVRYQTL